MIVVDASVLMVALADDSKDGDRARNRLLGEVLFAPELIDLEVASALRRLVLAGELDGRRAESALLDLFDVPLSRGSHLPLLTRCWELRSNRTIYDSAYVALAEAIGCSLLTADPRLANAPGFDCPVEIIGTSAWSPPATLDPNPT
ncbi:MAG: type II toxin-antitoxin system VapC family toxin [Acidimicrobiia bacterium]|nr:type II toxin-antitoxin system VapC family toxin [Acidimicrobiia bacterium]